MGAAALAAYIKPARIGYVVPLVVGLLIGKQSSSSTESIASSASQAPAPKAVAANPDESCQCEVRSVRYDSGEAAAVLSEHIRRNIPLRIDAVPQEDTPLLTDGVLRTAVGHRTISVRKMSAGGRVPKKAERRDITVAEVLGDGDASSHAYYAAQLSIPQKLPELQAHVSVPDLNGTWADSAGEPLPESPYMYYYGGSTGDLRHEQADGHDLAKMGPGLYLHYDAAENMVQMLDGWKEFWLYDPFQASSVLYGSNKEHGNGSPVNVEDVNETLFPHFKYALPRRCTIGKGEWLYVPLYWWHFVRSGARAGERTVSLAHFHRGNPSKKGFFQKIMCGYSLPPAAFECA